MNTAANASTQTAAPDDGAASGGAGGALAHRRMGLALPLIATAQLMVILDATIVNVALPQIQHALGFSGSSLQWVVNAFSITFAGLLLLGGRAADILGRRKVFIAGAIVFSLASLAGGFATSQGWLLAARAAQGAGGAILAPTALSLVTTTFPEGRARNRAMSVYGAISIAGGAAGLIAGGLLTTYASWRWVLFVNVPIGIAVAAAAPLVLRESQRSRGRFDLPGALTGTLGLAALVYGLSDGATGQNGVSHWGEPKVVASLAAAGMLLVSFGVIEASSRDPLMPLRMFRSRNRSGAYVIVLCVGTAIFGLFFFLTIFMQAVWGYSALRTGIAYLPMMAGTMTSSLLVGRIVARTGPRPLLVAGSAVTAVGMFWLAQITERSSYLTGLAGPLVLTAIGMGMLTAPLVLVAMSRVRHEDAGLASSLLQTGQQVGGSIGLAVLGSIVWTVVAGSIRQQIAPPAATAGDRVHGPAVQVPARVYHHALAAGFSRGFEVAACAALLALIVTLAVIRVERLDGTGSRKRATDPQPGNSRPNSAPAYYLGRPAGQWIRVTRPRRRHSPRTLTDSAHLPVDQEEVSGTPRQAKEAP